MLTIIMVNMLIFCYLVLKNLILFFSSKVHISLITVLKRRYTLKRNKLMKITIFFLGIMGIIFIVFANPFNKLAKETEYSTKEITNNELIVYTKEYERLVSDLRYRLHKKNYGFILDYAISSDEKVDLLIKLPDKEIKKSTKKEIQQLITKIIEQNDFDPNLFQIRIESYYEITKEGNRSSVRLSYNDVMGHILENMLKEDYNTFSIEHKISPENINVTINLPIGESDESTKKELEQIAVDVIKQNNFDPNLFQITVTNHIITND